MLNVFVKIIYKVFVIDWFIYLCVVSNVELVRVIICQFLESDITTPLHEPRHDKMCLREFLTRPDTNRPAQPQKLARVLKFRL